MGAVMPCLLYALCQQTHFRDITLLYSIIQPLLSVEFDVVICFLLLINQTIKELVYKNI